MKTHRKAIKRTIYIVLLLWCLWYVRPVDVHFLLTQTGTGYIEGYVMPQADFPHISAYNFRYSFESSKGEKLMKELEALRFHRSPIEPILRILPPLDGGFKTIDPEEDYTISIVFFSKDWEQIQTLCFEIDEWSYGPYEKLPLYVYHGQETGRKLGTILMEMVE